MKCDSTSPAGMRTLGSTAPRASANPLSAAIFAERVERQLNRIIPAHPPDLVLLNLTHTTSTSAYCILSQRVPPVSPRSRAPGRSRFRLFKHYREWRSPAKRRNASLRTPRIAARKKSQSRSRTCRNPPAWRYSFTGMRIGAPLSLTRKTRNFAGFVSLAFFPTR
jgi:hypothetical protein